MSLIESIRISTEEHKPDESQPLLTGRTADSINHSVRGGEKQTMMTVEEREHGRSSLRTWLLWFSHAGGLFFLSFQIIFMTVDRFAYVATEFWLARWTQGAESSVVVFGVTFSPQTDGRSAQYDYLIVYGSILLISVLSTFVRSEWSGKLVPTGRTVFC